MRRLFIRKTTDFVAIIALVLALITLIIQGRQFLDQFYGRPDLAALPPFQVVLYNSDVLKDFPTVYNPPQLLPAIITGYDNEAPKDDNAIVIDEFMTIKGPKDRNSIFWIYKQGNSDTPKKFVFDNSARAVPFVVPGLGAFAHEAIFVPMFSTIHCRDYEKFCNSPIPAYRWQDFVDDLPKSKPQSVSLTIQTGAWLANMKTVTQTCRVTLNGSAQDENTQIGMFVKDGFLSAECSAVNN